MQNKSLKSAVMLLLLLGFTACEELPGDKKTQGAAIGGVAGAVVGAAVGGSEHRGTGAILGGILGAAGGYVVGAKQDKLENGDHDAAERAISEARSNPATAEEARRASTGDINRDGFVTLDEVIALEHAGFSDQEILRKLEATGQIFELTSDQESYLLQNGVSRNVVSQLLSLNQDARNRYLSSHER